MLLPYRIEVDMKCFTSYENCSMRNLLLCLLLVSISFPSQLNAEQPIEPGKRPEGQVTAMHQCVGMMIAASLASKTDLTPIFVDQYKLPLDPAVRKKLSRVNWKHTRHTAGEIFVDLPEKLIAN